MFCILVCWIWNNVSGEFQNFSSLGCLSPMVVVRKDTLDMCKKRHNSNEILKMMANFNEPSEKKFLKPNNLW